MTQTTTQLLTSRLLTPAEVAGHLRVTPRVVVEMLRAGKLAGVKVGRAWRIREDALAAYESGHPKSDRHRDNFLAGCRDLAGLYT